MLDCTSYICMRIYNNFEIICPYVHVKIINIYNKIILVDSKLRLTLNLLNLINLTYYFDDTPVEAGYIRTTKKRGCQNSEVHAKWTKKWSNTGLNKGIEANNTVANRKRHARLTVRTRITVTDRSPQ